MSSFEKEPKSEIKPKSYSLHKLNRIAQQEIFKVENTEKFDSLTSRELEIFHLLVKNFNNP
jgi:hypothetical protein